MAGLKVRESPHAEAFSRLFVFDNKPDGRGEIEGRKLQIETSPTSVRAILVCSYRGVCRTQQMCRAGLFEVPESSFDVAETKMNETVATKDRIRGWEPIARDVQQRKLSALVLEELSIASDQGGHHIRADIFYVPEICVSHPVEVATGSVKQRLRLQIME